MFSALLALALAQQDQTAFRLEKDVYNVAVSRCKEGEALIDSDPRGAIEKFDAIIQNAAIKKIECRLRIEDRPSEYSAYYLFLPYQYRGRARVNAAKRLEGEAAEKLLAGASEDFQKSVDSGVKTSADLLAAAKAELEKVRAAMAKPPPVVADDPLAKFRPRWQQLTLERKYKSARALIDTEGKALTDAQRKTLADETVKECLAYFDSEMLRFRRSLTGIRGFEDLSSLSDREFQAAFSLPDARELTFSSPAHDWAVKHTPLLKEAQAKSPVAWTRLLDAAIAARALEEEAENPWFKALATLAFSGAHAGVVLHVRETQDAPKAKLEANRKTAEESVQNWKKTIEQKLSKIFRERNRVDELTAALERLLEGIPSDLAELEKFGIADAFANANPDAALAKHEQALKALEGRANVTRESRQALYGWIVTVGALRALYAGRSEEDAAKELAAYAEKLKAVGASAESKHYGPRVDRVFEILLR